MNKNVVMGILATVVVVGGAYWLIQDQNGASNPPSYDATKSSAPAPTPAPSSTPTPTRAPAPVTHNVTIQNFAFNPASIVVKKGDMVVWTNKDPTGHTVTGNNGGPSSPAMSANGTYRYTWNGVGTFGYHCALHPSMTGTVVVR